MRRFVGMATILAVLSASPALAFEPQKPECVAPAKPGGGFDLTCRIAVSALEAVNAVDKPISVTFLPGGVGAVAYNLFNTTRADDGDAIVALSSGSALNIATGKFGNWSEDDARFVASAGADYGAIIVRADSPYQTLDSLMAKLKEDPGSLVLGAGGSVGSQDWMKAALLVKSVGQDPRKMRYVAFEGGGEAIAALLGGTTDVYPGDVSEMKAHLDAGTMRILAVLAPERLPEPFAQYQTAQELGYDVEWVIFRGYYMGKDVPDEAYAFWVDGFEKAYASPEFAKIQKDKGLFPLNMAGKEFDSYVKSRVAAQREIAKEAGLIK